MRQSQPIKPAKLYYGWVIVIAGLLVSAVLIGSRQSYGVFFKSIESDFELNRTVTSAIFSAFMALSAVFSALGGIALDKFGPKKTVAAMGFCTGISLIITSQMQEVWQLFLTYSLIMAMGTGEAYTIVVGFVSRWFIKKRGVALGIMTTGGGIGSLIYAPFATFLIVAFQWNTAMIILGAIALVVVISLAMLLKGHPGEIGLLPDGIRPQGVIDTNASEKRPAMTGLSLTQALKTNQFWMIFMIWVFHGAAVYIITTHIIPHAIDLGVSPVPAAGILSVMSLFHIVGALSAGALSDRFGRKRVAVISMLVGAVSLFWLMWMPGEIWQMYAFAALFGIPFGSQPVIVSALLGDMFGMRSIGKIVGAIGVSWFIGAAVGPVIGGLAYDITGSYFLAFLIGALCMLITALFFAVLSRPKTQEGAGAT